MNAYQRRRRRIVFWCGSFPVLVGFTVLMFALILADQVAPLTPQELDGVDVSQQARYSPKLVNQKAESTLAVSQ